jgi:hypothetical protein
LDIAIGAIEKHTGSSPTVGAAAKYLGIMKKPQSLTDVSSAFERGGLIHQSKNFITTVYTTLRRAEDRGDRVRRFHKNWALASWYPNRPRALDEAAQPKADGT